MVKKKESIITKSFNKSSCLVLYTLCVCVCVCVCVFSHVRAHQTPLSMGFSRQEYGAGYHFPFQGNLPNPGIEPVSLTFPALVDEFSATAHLGNIMGFYEFIMTCSRHYSIIQNSFSALNILCAPPFHPFLPLAH